VHTRCTGFPLPVVTHHLAACASARVDPGHQDATWCGRHVEARSERPSRIPEPRRSSCGRRARRLLSKPLLVCDWWGCCVVVGSGTWSAEGSVVRM
jgi:hypothetical protein